jgi:HEAT repeat protein
MIPAVQTAMAQDASAVTDAIRHIQSDDLGTQPKDRLTYVNIIAHAKAVEAIPLLEDFYTRATDPEIRLGVASALVRMGDAKDIYWNYLVTDAIRRIKSNDLGSGPVDALSYVNLIAQARAVEAIPLLEDYYTQTTDPEIKAGVASALVRMGDNNELYWAYLVTLATPAAETDAPTPWDLGGEKGAFSPEFKAWATNHELSFEAAYKLVTEDLLNGLGPLARTGDPRGVPLLRKALTSPNLSIASLAAGGLAQAQDKSSISLIVAACRRVPPMLAPFLADALMYFDDPQARSVFKSYSPGVNVDEARKFAGGPFGSEYSPRR